MKTIKPPFSIRLIYWFTNIILGLLTLVFLAAVIFNVLLYTDFFGSDLQLHSQLPVKVNFLETGNLQLNDQDIKVELVEATTKIHFFNTPSFITKKIGIVILIIVLGIGYLTWIFRLFIKNVKEGIIFTINNIKLLKRISYGLVAFWLFTTIYMQVFYHYIAKQLEFKSVEITGEMVDYSGILLFALFIWVLAHIFITGLKLQQENELTI